MSLVFVLGQRPSLPVLPPIILCVALLASLAVFFTLTRRVTSQRVRIALSEWARENGFRLIRSMVTLPPPLVELIDPDLRAHWTLTSEATTIIQVIRRSPTN